MDTQVVELHEAVMTLLLQMESELEREKLSLALCDAWMELEHIVLELEEVINE